MSNLRITLSWTVILLCLFLGGCGMWWFVKTIEFMKQADMAYRATGHAADAIENYVRENNKWPISWSDLESVSPATGSPYLLPDQLKETRTYVMIDFSITLDEVASQEVSDFDAIKPIGPIWGGYRDTNFTSLLNTVRAGASSTKTKSTAKFLPEEEMRSQKASGLKNPSDGK